MASFRLPVTRLAINAIKLHRKYASLAPAQSQVAVDASKLNFGTQKQKPSPHKVDLPPPNPDQLPDSPTGRLVESLQAYMVATYQRPPIIFQRGQGVHIWDTEGRKYVDLTGGIAVNALGHCDEQIAQIITEQARTLVHCSNLYHNPWAGALSRRLVECTLGSGGMHNAARAFICNSGTEANEAALKFARKVGQAVGSHAKNEIVSFSGAFHGRTLGALSATPSPKYQQPFAPLLPGFKTGKLNEIAGLDELINSNTAGVIIEPIQGEGGIYSATPEFLMAVAKRCRTYNAVLIYDEIQCGLGRTGDFWAHGTLPKAAHPDIITTAKALGNGFPVAATITNSFVADKIKIGDHGTTFGGNPLGSRVACHVLDRLSDRKLLASVAVKSHMLKRRFEQWQKRWPHVVGEIRGRGLILGLQLSQDPNPIVKAARERGLLVITAGSNTLRFLPALTIEPEEIDQGCDLLEEAIQSELS